jgi:hypothetical protein
MSSHVELIRTPAVLGDMLLKELLDGELRILRLIRIFESIAG